MKRLEENREKKGIKQKIVYYERKRDELQLQNCNPDQNDEVKVQSDPGPSTSNTRSSGRKKTQPLKVTDPKSTTVKKVIKAITKKQRKKKSVTSEKKKAYEREKKRKQRAKIYADENLHADFLHSQKLYYQKKKKEGKIVPISAKSQREQTLERRKWKVRQRNHRQKKKEEKELLANCTPPVSPSELGVTSSRNDERSSSGKKRARRFREKLKKENKILKERVQKYKRQAEKYRKRVERAKSKKYANLSPSPNKVVKQIISKGKNEVRRSLTFAVCVTKQIKANYKSALPKEKAAISKVIAGKILKKYRMTKGLKNVISLHRYRTAKSMPGLLQKKNGKFKEKMEMLKASVHEFFCDDEITTQAPGKKDFVTLNKERKNKRYLNDTMKNLHKKFLERHGYVLGYSTFCKLKPYFVTHLKVNARDTCACVRHLNMQLKLTKLKQLRVIESDNMDEIIKSLTCDGKMSQDCMLRKCEKCKNKTLQVEDYEKNEEVFCYQWIQKNEERVNKQGKNVLYKIQCKDKIIMSQEKLVVSTAKEIPVFLVHMFTIQNQYQYSRQIKEIIDENAAVVKIDFSENYNCKYFEEIQALHFGGSRKQLTLHTGVYYVLEVGAAGSQNKDLKCHSFCSISEDLRHTAPSVWAHLHPVLKSLRQRGVTTLHIFSDGACGQYKNRRNFFLLCYFANLLQFQTVTWNFWESGHGKGPSDGVGAVCKTKADRQVAKGIDVTNAKAFIAAISEIDVQLFLVTSEEINKIEEFISAEIKLAPGIRHVHQLVWRTQNNDELYLRTFSCTHSSESHHPCKQCDFSKPKYKVLTSHATGNTKSKTKETQPPSQSSKQQESSLVTLSSCRSRSSSVPALEDREEGISIDDYNREDRISDGDWVAVLFEKTWYPGQVTAIEVTGDRKILKIKFMARSRTVLSNSFYYKESRDSHQNIFSDEIICKISPPQPKGKYERTFSFKEFEKIETLVSQNESC